MDSHIVLIAFSLSVVAGLSTGIGSALAFFAPRPNKTLLSVALGFSAGVMLYVSFMELLPEARKEFAAVLGPARGAWLAAASFLGGAVCMALVDRLIPSYENPHEVRSEHDLGVLHTRHPDASQLEEMKTHLRDHRLLRVGMFTALAIAIHNFPEGLATFAATLANPMLGVSIAVAIALHNIPEGISVSVPLFYATNDRRKAFLWSFYSGLVEPVGAVAAFILLQFWLSPVLLGGLFAAVAGVMIYLALDELLPTARAYGQGHLVIYGTLAGMAVMACGLLLLA